MCQRPHLGLNLDAVSLRLGERCKTVFNVLGGLQYSLPVIDQYLCIYAASLFDLCIDPAEVEKSPPQTRDSHRDSKNPCVLLSTPLNRRVVGSSPPEEPIFQQLTPSEFRPPPPTPLGTSLSWILCDLLDDLRSRARSSHDAASCRQCARSALPS